MNQEELVELVKEVGLPRDLEGSTILRVRGRAYQIPWLMSEWQVEKIERDMPDDSIMRLLGYRFPDLVTWIEPEPTPVIPYLPWKI